MRKHLTSKTLRPLILILCLLAAGCSSNDNPTAPTIPDEDDPIEIRTPKTLKITKISVGTFGEKNGGNWDISTSVSKRRPDIYVQLRGGTSSNAPFYVSTIVDDAFSGAGYTFIKSSAGVGLPKNHAANRKLYIELMDYDGLSADDFMGSVAISPLSYYKDDNATRFYQVLNGSNGTKMSVYGTWLY